MHRVNALFNCAQSYGACNMYIEETAKGYSLQIFRICFFCDFLQRDNLKLEFSPKAGVIRQLQEKNHAPP